MARAAAIEAVNCGKNRAFHIFLENELDIRRGDPTAPYFVCSQFCPVISISGPSSEVESDHLFELPIIPLDIQVEKSLEEVNDPRDGIKVTCQASCMYNQPISGV